MFIELNQKDGYPRILLNTNHIVNVTADPEGGCLIETSNDTATKGVMVHDAYSHVHALLEQARLVVGRSLPKEALHAA